MTQYSIIVTEPNGTRLWTVPYFSHLLWVRSLNNKGYFELEVTDKAFPKSLFAVDRFVQIWRKPPYYPPQMVFVGMMQFRRRFTSGNRQMMLIKGPDLVDILDTRIIAAASGSTGADKSDTADDVMKAYVRENLGASADSARTRSTYITVDADTNAGPSVTKSASRDRLLNTLRDLSDAAYQKGTPVYFDVEMSGASLAFRTYVGQRGINLTNSVVLSEERGTLANVSLEEDYRDEVNYVYAGGQGEGVARQIVPLEEVNRSSMSIWHRREAFFDGRNYATTNALTDAGYNRLRQGRPTRVFSGDLINGKNFQYSVHWGYGDKVKASYDDEQYTVEVASVTGRVDPKGKESLSGKLRVA